MSRIATNLTVIDQALVSGTNFITGLLLARLLGIESYGLFVLLSGVILFVSNIQNAIIISPMMINGPARKDNDAHTYYQTTVVLQILLTLIVFLLIFSIGTLLNIHALNHLLDDLILPLALASSGLLLQEYFRRYFFSKKKTIQAIINDSLSYGLQLSAIIILNLTYDFNIELCLYIMAATSFLAVIHGVISSGLLINAFKISAVKYKETILEHWVFGKWLIAKNISYWCGTQMILYITGIFLSIAAVGAMGAARNIVGIVNILFLALDNFATPRASNFYSSHGIQGLSKYTARLTVIGGVATAGIGVVASIAPEFWLNLVYSEEYKGYGWLVIGWSIFFFIGYFQRPYGIALRVLNSTKSIFKGTLIGTTVALILIYPAIMLAELYGAMGTLIIVQTIITMYYVYSYKKQANLICHPQK